MCIQTKRPHRVPSSEMKTHPSQAHSKKSEHGDKDDPTGFQEIKEDPAGCHKFKQGPNIGIGADLEQTFCSSSNCPSLRTLHPSHCQRSSHKSISHICYLGNHRDMALTRKE